MSKQHNELIKLFLALLEVNPVGGVALPAIGLLALMTYWAYSIASSLENGFENFLFFCAFLALILVYIVTLSYRASSKNKADKSN